MALKTLDEWQAMELTQLISGIGKAPVYRSFGYCWLFEFRIPEAGTLP